MLKITYELYNKTRDFAKARQLEILPKQFNGRDWLTEKEFTIWFQTHKFIIVGMQDTKDKVRHWDPRTQNRDLPVYTYVVICSSYIIAKKQNTTKMYRAIPNYYTKNHSHKDIVMVVPHTVSSSTIRNFKSENRWNDDYINILHIPYHQFRIDPMEHKNTPHIRVVAEDEKQKILDKEVRCDIGDLPERWRESAMCIWRGAVLGDLLEVVYNSSVCGKMLKYCQVIDMPIK